MFIQQGLEQTLLFPTCFFYLFTDKSFSSVNFFSILGLFV